MTRCGKGGPVLSDLDGDIGETLACWDGKHAASLKACLRRNRNDAELPAALLQRIGSDAAITADGASWLLKAGIEDGLTLSEKQTGSLVALLPSLHSKDTILHICQIVRHLTLTSDQAKATVQWLEEQLTHERPFLRAWSLDALVAVAVHYPNYQDRATAALERAKQDPAASVRARVRNLPGI